MEEEKILADDAVAEVSGGHPIQPNKNPSPYKKTFGDSDDQSPE
jgi:hypothetical protein